MEVGVERLAPFKIQLHPAPAIEDHLLLAWRARDKAAAYVQTLEG
jgi:hypothetical protein